MDLGTSALTPAHVGRFTLAPHDWDDPFIRLAEASKGRHYALWTTAWWTRGDSVDVAAGAASTAAGAVVTDQTQDSAP